VKAGDLDRKAIVYPAKGASSKKAPLVFVFHGFTGNARQAAFSYKVHEAWPEATVVYPQGLEVQLLGRKAPGWQIAPKMQDDRDLAFFDALLSKVDHDAKRVYTCGMSNGAIFSYVLLAARNSTLAAAAPVAGYAAPAFRGSGPVPILITHGKEDNLVPLKAAERSRDWAIANNGSGDKSKEWMAGYTLYTPVKDGNEVIWHLHDGGHSWPKGTTDAIVKFFKVHSLP
jgi:poly(3-hydroxybutyrate) depolymerase